MSPRDLYTHIGNYTIFGPLPDDEILYRYGLKADYFRITVNLEELREGGRFKFIHVNRFASKEDLNLYMIYKPDWMVNSTHLIFGEIGSKLTVEDIKSMGL